MQLLKYLCFCSLIVSLFSCPSGGARKFPTTISTGGVNSAASISYESTQTYTPNSDIYIQPSRVGTGAISCSASGLPPELQIGSNDCIISRKSFSGVSEGSYNISVNATHSSGLLSASFLLIISTNTQTQGPTLSYPQQPPIVSEAPISIEAIKTGSPKCKTTVGKTNPTGILIDENTCRIYGSIKSPGQLLIYVTGANNISFVDVVVTLTINSTNPNGPKLIYPPQTASIVSGAPINIAPTTKTGSPAPTCETTSGKNNPSGIIIHPTTCHISGSITAAAGSYSIYVTAKNSFNSFNATVVVNIIAAPAATLKCSDLNAFNYDASYTNLNKNGPCEYRYCDEDPDITKITNGWIDDNPTAGWVTQALSNDEKGKFYKSFEAAKNARTAYLNAGGSNLSPDPIKTCFGCLDTAANVQNKYTGNHSPMLAGKCIYSYCEVSNANNFESGSMNKVTQTQIPTYKENSISTNLPLALSLGLSANQALSNINYSNGVRICKGCNLVPNKTNLAYNSFTFTSTDVEEVCKWGNKNSTKKLMFQCMRSGGPISLISSCPTSDFVSNNPNSPNYETNCSNILHQANQYIIENSTTKFPGFGQVIEQNVCKQNAFGSELDQYNLDDGIGLFKWDLCRLAKATQNGESVLNSDYLAYRQTPNDDEYFMNYCEWPGGPN